MIHRRRSDLRFGDLPGRASADPFGQVPEAEGLSVRVVRLVAAPTRSPHRHPHSAEVVYVTAGRGRVWVDGRTRAVAAGDVCLVPAGVPHATLPDRGTQMELVCFFPHGDLSANLEELDEVLRLDDEDAG